MPFNWPIRMCVILAKNTSHIINKNNGRTALILTSNNNFAFDTQFTVLQVISVHSPGFKLN